MPRLTQAAQSVFVFAVMACSNQASPAPKDAGEEVSTERPDAAYVGYEDGAVSHDAALDDAARDDAALDGGPEGGCTCSFGTTIVPCGGVSACVDGGDYLTCDSSGHGTDIGSCAPSQPCGSNPSGFACSSSENCCMSVGQQCCLKVGAPCLSSYCCSPAGGGCVSSQDCCAGSCSASGTCQ